MRRREGTVWICVLVLVLTMSAALVASGCGKSSTDASVASAGQTSETTSSTKFAKTKFALHAGLAFGAFHRYIYKPYKSGAFSGGLFHRKLTTVKAGLAAAFAYHELKLALADARGSAILSKALSPLLALQTKLNGLTSSLKDGKVDAASLESANTDTSSIAQAGQQAGQPVSDQPTPSFGG